MSNGNGAHFSIKSTPNNNNSCKKRYRDEGMSENENNKTNIITDNNNHNNIQDLSTMPPLKKAKTATAAMDQLLRAVKL